MGCSRDDSFLNGDHKPTSCPKSRCLGVEVCNLQKISIRQFQLHLELKIWQREQKDKILLVFLNIFLEHFHKMIRLTI